MDLSKAFDAINYSLLLAKLEAYDFSIASLKLMQSYIVQLMGKKIETRVPQRSIQRPLLFNIFLHDVFYFINNGNLLNHSDDNKLCSIEKKN